MCCPIKNKCCNKKLLWKGVALELHGLFRETKEKQTILPVTIKKVKMKTNKYADNSANADLKQH